MADNVNYTGLTAEHISTNLAQYEAARTGFFNFVLPPKIRNFVRYTYTGRREDVFDESGNVLIPNAVLGETAQEVLKLNVVAADFPDFSLDVLQYTRGNEYVKFAGRPTWDAGSIKVDDIVGLDTLSIMEAWKAAAYNVHTRKGGRMVNYKLDCQLVEYTQDYVPVRVWDVYGCWCSDVKREGMDKENDGKRQINSTIQFDRMVMSFDADSESVYNN